MLNDDLLKALEEKYDANGEERVGFIFGDELHEVKNTHPDPTLAFNVELEDIELLESTENAWAIWHTQPSRLSQLSYEDYVGFLNFPEFKHIVIGADGVRMYRVENGAVFKDDLRIR